ncbi:hypothetical protein [Spirilliplanes yamanashiensis]|uniref:Uncharacterized protein n=1 Tax=Spirilliplanes yamanashiensis TaxID=42233 RepID=A0A8J3YEJ2_9ACTN|nr:hypothetical protein [Spirilliplanes yamanashiensis]MDP9815257.1 hypothetical protein [Spirilliplanes yamanashiensis]GIJ06474.1 hypothetical protein Sya03_58260 [Spirilliplanes yamanashiensis]
MPGTVLLDRAVFVSYATARANPGDDAGHEPDRYWRGQANGLCGAAVRGHLVLVTGLHTGYVRMTVELHPAEPPLGDEWEDAVEAPFRQRAKKLWVGGLMDRTYPARLPPGDYRVRYCARGMEQGRRQDTAGRDEIVDAYLLQFWPADPAPDRVVRQTTDIAARYHAKPRKPAPTAAERAERKLRKAERRRRKAAARPR